MPGASAGASAGAADDIAIARIVSRAQLGEDAALAELYLIFFQPISCYLRARLTDPEDAQDLAQDLFERLITTLSAYDPARGPFRGWIFAIARNLAIDERRKRSRSKAVAPDAIPEHASPPGRGVPGHGVDSVIDGLTDAQRRVLVLRFTYELRFAEIALLLGSSSAAVRQVQQRALRELGSGVSPESMTA